MKPAIKFLTIVIVGVLFSGLLNAQDYQVISVPKDAKPKLKTARTVAVFLNSNDPLLNRIAEDALFIHLTNSGFTVINRELLEKTVGEQIVKKTKEKSESALNALEIGKALNADAIITGTLIFESKEQSVSLVKVASLQVIEVKTGKNLLNLLAESAKGKSISETARVFVTILKQNSG